MRSLRWPRSTAARAALIAVVVAALSAVVVSAAGTTGRTTTGSTATGNTTAGVHTATHPAPRKPAPGKPAGYAYYLALGDSLAAGYQPRATTGAGYLSGHGYADDLAGELRTVNHRLDYVNLGCPGETTASMLHGGCSWPETYATQLGAATSFLTGHRGARVLVTLDIGANDIDSCASGTGVDPVCLATGIAAARANIPVILRDLRAAAGSAATIVGLTYYDPFLSYWLTGASGKRIATTSVALVDAFNSALRADYAAVGVRVADVASAFGIDSVLPLVRYQGTLVPLDVDRVCASTWMCAARPTGPNVHPNDAGYRLIYQAVRSALPR